MKEIELTKGYKTQVDDDDYDELVKYKWCVIVCPKTNYARRGQWNGRKVISISMHRVILGISDPKIEVDHIDGNGLNNQRSNIRKCDRSINMQNKQSSERSMSKYVGVNRQFGRHRKVYWRSRITVGQKRIHIGLFKTDYDAALARDQFILNYNIEFTRLNILKRP
jgi:hypothetical protein